MRKRGRLITIEGPEGSGKSTLTELLVNELVAMGIPAVKSKEPGTAFDAKLRSIILNDRPAPMAELFLFLADRAEHIAKYVQPTLDNGTWVILDRFSDSTVIYQAIAKQVAIPSTVESLCRLAEQGCIPDRTLVLEASFDTCQRRLSGRADQIKRVAQQGGVELERKIHQAYMGLPTLHPDRCRALSVETADPNDALDLAMEALDDQVTEYRRLYT